MNCTDCFEPIEKCRCLLLPGDDFFVSHKPIFQQVMEVPDEYPLYEIDDED